MTKIFGTILAAFAMVGMPLFAVLGGISILCWLTADDPKQRVLRRIAANLFGTDALANSEILVTIPLFVFTGYLMAESNAPRRIVRAGTSALGWLPGGLAIVCVVASAGFTVLTGGSGVTIVAIGGLLMPVLIQQGYDKDFALGLVTTSGAVGLLLPPSPLVIVYCYVTRVEVNRAYYATLWPGLLLIGVLSVYCMFVGIRRKIPRQAFSPTQLAKDLWVVKWEAFAPLLVLIGMGTALFQLHEAAAAAAMYTLIVEVYVTRDLKWRHVFLIGKEAISLAGAIIVILAVATGLTNYVVTAELPKRLLEWFISMGVTELWQFIIVLNIFLFILGTAMEEFSILLVGLPLLVPLAAKFGMHPFYLAVIFLLNLEIAYITPPVGLNLYISSFRFKRPVTDVYRVVMPFCGLLAIGLLIVAVFPKLSTFTVDDDAQRLREEAQQKGIAPIQAWALECIQQDPPNYVPCLPADIETYGADGRRVALVEATSEEDREAVKKLEDDSVSEEEKRRIRKEQFLQTDDELVDEFDEPEEDDDADAGSPDAGRKPPPAKGDAGDDEEEELELE